MMISCGNSKKATTTDNGKQTTAVVEGQAFSKDSAYVFCEQQCAFGPRTMNSEAHDRCEDWIAGKFEQYGMTVQRQKAKLFLYDNTEVKATNIIASYKPEANDRILLCAHWDTRPWADNDPDSANWRKPVLGANDGASGVAVMIEIARVISKADSIGIGIDFICFDAEDSGIPQWSNVVETENSWALGSEHWANNMHKEGYNARFGILLDMVGGMGARFYKEGFSEQYASPINDLVWRTAHRIGFSSFFPMTDGWYITDDHVAVNQTARIPTIDIIPYFPDCPASTFGPTWHTVNDNMQNIDKNTLNAVGQTVLQVIFDESKK